MGWLDTLGTVLETAGAVAQANQVYKWLRMDFQTAVGEVAYIVQNYPAEVTDAYEVVMLRASGFIIDPDERVTLMKLYALLKLAETERYGFRGFASL